MILEKVYIVIKFNEKSGLKIYTELNSKLRQKAKNDFGKDFRLMNNAAFWKNYGKCEKT